MSDDISVPRSRRALLAAAAGGAAALAASAALPLSVAAHDTDDVAKGTDNASTATTSITNSTADSTALAVSAVGTGFGLQATSISAAGVFAWSVSAPDTTPADTGYTGVYGFAPQSFVQGFSGSGVWGDSDDTGVFGSGGVGVYGYGGYGVIGESASTSPAILALAKTATDVALEVRGKVKFSRSGSTSVTAGHSTRTVYLAGVTSSSQVLAVLRTNRSSRWVRAVVPSSGKFVIYLNATVSATTNVSFFVLN